MKKITLAGVLAGLCLLANAQRTAIKPLTVGDTVPDISLENIHDYPYAHARFSDFKGKLIILDFWSTWCKACINSFPELQKLQDANPGKIQIILVTNNSLPQVQKLFTNLRSKGVALPELPLITADSILSSLFVHTMVPHVVWIDANGVVRAITGSEQTTQQNLDVFFTKGTISLPVKNDQLQQEAAFTSDQPGTGEPATFGQPAFSKKIDGIPSLISVTIDSARHKRVITLSNITLRQMYEYAIGKTFPDNRIIAKGEKGGFKDSMYNYKTEVALAGASNNYNFLLPGLQKYLPLKADVKMIDLPCWQLNSNIKQGPLFTGKKKSDYNFKTKAYNQVNGTIQDLVNILDYYAPRPVFNGTGLSPHAALQIQLDFSDERSLQQSLARNGFTLTKITKKVEVLILE